MNPYVELVVRERGKLIIGACCGKESGSAGEINFNHNSLLTVYVS